MNLKRKDCIEKENKFSKEKAGKKDGRMTKENERQGEWHGEGILA
jgi:hypothetical protein